jgi:hypothetical protein
MKTSVIYDVKSIYFLEEKGHVGPINNGLRHMYKMIVYDDQFLCCFTSAVVMCRASVSQAM